MRIAVYHDWSIVKFVHCRHTHVPWLVYISVCTVVSNQSIMMVADYHPATYSTIKSYAHYLNVPILVPGGSGSGVEDPYRYDLSLLPPTIDAIIDVIKFFQWNSVVYYLFDTNDGES